MGKYLDLIGLGYLIEKIQATFIKKTDTIEASTIEANYFATKEELCEDEEIISGALTDLNQNKQDIINDLDDIRAGAALGATSLQSYTETDPTVPSWAKANTKPSYTLDEVTDGNTRKLANYLPLAGGPMAGKIYMTGVNSGNSTSSTSQIIFGDNGATNKVAISSNGNNIIINPNTSSTTGQIIITPGSSSNIKVNNNTVWHAGNDGTGSTLDADLLDGQHGSYYAPLASPALTGTPTAPTAAANTDTTQIATTAFVKATVDSKVHYVANLQAGTAANYITEPEVKSVKINGSSTNSASSSNCVMQYDTTNKCLKFIFN